MMSSSSDEEIGSMTPAFMVPTIPKNYKPSTAPSSAEEYLRQVMYEAQNCEKTVTINLDRSKIKKCKPIVQIQRKAVSSANFLPSREMQAEIITNFSKLSQRIETLKKKDIPASPVQLPGNEKEEEWCTFCYGKKMSKMIYDKNSSATNNQEHTDDDTASGQKPLLSIIMNIKPRAFENLLNWNVFWLENYGFSYSQGQWIYSLLTALEKPILPELYSSLREIVFKCAKIRSELNNVNHPHLQQLNTIICIITKEFNQLDLAD